MKQRSKFRQHWINYCTAVYMQKFHVKHIDAVTYSKLLYELAGSMSPECAIEWEEKSDLPTLL
jgi:hypothetical protein